MIRYYINDNSSNIAPYNIWAKAAEIQTNINVQVANKAYIPLINKEGLPRA